MLTLILAALQAVAPVVAPEAADLGVRLARTSGLASIAPALIEKDIAELVRENGSLTEPQRSRLTEIGRREGQAGVDRIVRAIGREYARRLSVEDLRQLVEHNETPAAGRLRAAEPAVLVGAMTGLGSIDLKKDIKTAFCRETGKLCSRD